MIRLKRAEPDSLESFSARKLNSVADIFAAILTVSGKIDADKHYFAESVIFKMSQLLFKLLYRF